MMNFRAIHAAIVTILGSQSEGRFFVIGYGGQSNAASDFLKTNKTVQVYYADGNFPKAGTRMRGPKTHDININLDMSVSAKATGDLEILDSPGATHQQKAAALLAIKTAAEIADTEIDELIEMVYQIIMDARNEGLGLEKGEVSNRWIDRIQKDTILQRGDLVVKTATMKYSCRVQEIVPGDIGVEPPTVRFNSDIKIGDSPGAGVDVINFN